MGHAGIQPDVLAQPRNVELVLQLLQGGDGGAVPSAIAKIPPMMWLLPKEKYEQQQAQHIVAVLQELLQAALEYDAYAMEVVADICGSNSGLKWLLECQQQLVVVFQAQLCQVPQQQQQQQPCAPEPQQRGEPQQSLVLASSVIIQLAEYTPNEPLVGS
jgi:hypothetical protein